MFENVIDKKIEKAKYKDYELLDLTSTIFNENKSNDIIFNVYRVPDSMKMRIDLVSIAAYGTDKYSDLLLKYNGISNPFSLDKDDILLIPTLDTIENDLKPIVTSAEAASKIRNYHRYIDKGKAPSNIGSQQSTIKIDKNVEYKEANLADSGVESITLRNGRIYFGGGSGNSADEIDCAVDGITASDFAISKIENGL